MEIQEGVVLRSTGSWYQVQTGDGTVLECRIKGRLRLSGIRSTNPVAVGDRVTLEPEGEQGLITGITDRTNYIIRKSTNLSKQTHVIAANMDQALLITTLVHPRTKLGFMDRFLVTAEAYRIPVTLVFNKIDLYESVDLQVMEELMAMYAKIGYQSIAVSAKTGDNLDGLKALMANKTTLLSGHSGVGKSTLINAVQPNLDLKTATVSDYNQKGRHTTTFAEMFPLDIGGFIIDTPGIRSFGLVDIDKSELYHYFPEMFRLGESCRFHNCVHINEPGCAVKAAVEAGEIAASRYENYLHLYEGDESY